MLSYRTFRNTDPPVLTAIWRSRAGQTELRQPISVDLLEQLVFGKTYFDYRGLILAFDEGRPVGFAHAAFGPNEKRDRISTETGVTCMVLVRPDCEEAEVAGGLLDQCEAYLRGRGAKVLYGGAIEPLNPFYLGLYGGSKQPGVLDSDAVCRDLYQSHGYEEIERTLIFRRDLVAFHPPIDRRQMQYRRQMVVGVKVDPPARSWWEACTTGDFDLTRFEVAPRGGGAPLASATVRGMDLTAASGHARGAGLLDVHVAPSRRRQGLATFLLGESFRQLSQQGFGVVEAHATCRNLPGLALLRKLGLGQVRQGIVFRKSVDGV